MFGFQRLEVWALAIEYADRVYAVTRTFPESERFGLTCQLRRASVSVSSNVAEGSGRHSNPDFIRDIAIAYGSVMETVSQATVASRQEFHCSDDYHNLCEMAERFAQMLSRLRSSLKHS